MKRLVHCWEHGPSTEDGCSTTCMLWEGHDGPCEWVRDDEIAFSFPSNDNVVKNQRWIVLLALTLIAGTVVVLH
jgi:hypothetical protein